MIIDLNAFIGTWPSHPVVGDVEAVGNSLKAYGVDRIFVSPLEAAWCRNPHRFNQQLYESVEALEDVWPVPVLDPTVATWRKELDRVVERPEVLLVRLLPAYSPYRLSEADDLMEALIESGLGVIVQTRMEDPRRQHPLAQIPDVPAAEVADAAERHPDLTVIIGGPRVGEIRQIKDRLLKLPNLYADVSQAEGINAMRELVGNGLTEKLVFGSHAPMFIPYSALSRVLTDLDNETAAAILGGNAARLMGL